MARRSIPTGTVTDFSEEDLFHRETDEHGPTKNQMDQQDRDSLRSGRRVIPRRCASTRQRDSIVVGDSGVHA